ncbi:hypothetical protein AU106_gp184 [Sinorhizobium phage phiM9]|uniref:Uncharacterized protein n=1 Tax=Sinorhizobium phage phiM9 TaxID=1636182 RepID=A0A0F6R610_9CAUD|nr:hypothetical protein AU106_gp184 [Sinorhizobium phage phiM9]AKE44815.1 hypothetical protein Sm_phiM9_188 [Sinorhizobium phage phiM9]
MSQEINTSATIADFPLIGSMTKSPSSFVALSMATGIEEERLVNTIIPEVVKTDYWKRVGLSAKEIKAVLTHLGYHVKDLGITLHKKNDNHHTDVLHTRKMEKEFIEKNAKDGKTYIVISREHAWVIHNKVTIDPTWVAPNKQGSRRRLNYAFEIETAEAASNAA